MHQLLEHHLAEHLRNDIISCSQSSWCANPLLVEKGKYQAGDPGCHKQMRFCVSHQYLNSSAMVPAVSKMVSRVSDYLDAFSGSRYFSCIDMKSSDQQIGLNPESCPKTAFVTHQGLFQFNRCAMGLCVCSGAFVMCLNKCLTGLDCVIVYCDDLTIMLPTLSQHLKGLEAVFK